MEELVNIPALLLFSDGGTRFQSSSAFNGMCVACFKKRSRQIRINSFKRSARGEAFGGTNLSIGAVKKNL